MIFLSRKNLVRFVIVVIVLIGVLFFLFTAVKSPYSPLAWWYAPHEEIKVLVPDNYQGPVLIIYQVPNGLRIEKQNNTWIYPLRSNGVLLLQNDLPQSIVQTTFWYVKSDGSLNFIPPSTCFDNADSEDIVVCTGMMAVSANDITIRPNVSYAITSLKNKEKTLDEIFTKLYPEYREQLRMESNSLFPDFTHFYKSIMLVLLSTRKGSFLL